MWDPIIHGDLRTQALATIDSIAAAIREVAGIADPSLASGSAGLAILFAYLDKARPGCGDKETALWFLDQATRALTSVPVSLSLYGGATGVTWTIAHLRGWLVRADDDTTAAIDQLLRKGLSRGPWRGAYDLISGLVGFGVYALEQLPRPSAVECLAYVVDRLDGIAERTPDGITWFTSPKLLPESQRQLCPNGYYNLGIAHGVPGVIAFLAQVHVLDEREVRGVTKVRTKARQLLEGAVAWLLAQKSVGSSGSFFSDWIEPGITPTSSRVAWCYGDLGIAAALLAAARCVSNPSWKREAARLARRAAERSFAHSGVKDCGLCHGAAGVGHLFNRMFQASGRSWLKHAARRWFERVLEMRHPERGIAGIATFQLDRWSNELGILEGAAGIALALLAAVTPIEPRWDRMLLIS
jgi:lantibiotic biosynthesis protein